MTEPAPSRILVVEDDAHIRDILRFRLEKEGHQIHAAASAEEALERLREREFDVVLLDVNLGGQRSGLDVLREMREGRSLAEVILVTASESINVATEALRLGAVDYVSKPIDFSALNGAVRRAIEKAQLGRQEVAIHRLVERKARYPEIVSESAEMKSVVAFIGKAAPARPPVLILGETGTGKELVARSIHLSSPRGRAPFVDINCGAVPENLIESELFGHEKGAFTGADRQNRGLVEIAHGGTLFLDEMEDMGAGMQSKLLRFLESGEFRRVGGRAALNADVRIVAATNRAPAELIREKRLREDLFYRLSVMTIDLPPLRKRRDDVPLLARYFASVLSRETGRPRRLSDAAIQAFQRYRWPGNVRELRNLIERLVIVTEREVMDVSDLPQEIANPAGEAKETMWMTLEEVERKHILRVLDAVGQNRREAARVLGVSEMTLYRRLKDYGLASVQEDGKADDVAPQEPAGAGGRT